MKKFEHGQIAVTRGVYDAMVNNASFAEFVRKSLYEKYLNCDWGDTCDEDAKSNDYALGHEKRILAVYTQPGTDNTIWIITEWDRSVTTVLFPSEY